jgi:chaperonin GroEL
MVAAVQSKVIFQPQARQRLLRGVNQIVSALRPTLGPHARAVAVANLRDEQQLDLLDNGGGIARRIVQLADPDEDMGAMLAREMVMRLQDQHGDGTATAAVLLQAILQRAQRHLTGGGGNPVSLMAGLQKGMAVVLEHLNTQASPVTGEDMLTRIAAALCPDAQLAGILAEVFGIAGAFGQVDIRLGKGRDHACEYVEGHFWDRGAVSASLLAAQPGGRIDWVEPAFLISDLELNKPEQLYPALELALRTGIHSLIIIASKCSDDVIGFLQHNRRPDHFQAVVVTTPGYGVEQQMVALTDLALLTGGRAFIRAAGQTLSSIRPEDFGHSRRAWVDATHFGLVSGKGVPVRLRGHVVQLQRAYLQSTDTRARAALLERIGRLLPGSATVWIGGITEREAQQAIERAERTATALRDVMLEGVLPGGGEALLACRPALYAMQAQATSTDEQAAWRILAEALAEPFKVMAANAGLNPQVALSHVDQAGPGMGLDLRSGSLVNLIEAGICDPAPVLKASVYAAISTAVLALSVDVLVHRRQEVSPSPAAPSTERKRL